MYVFLVVLMVNGMYSVQAPNMVFPDLETCERVKNMNTEFSETLVHQTRQNSMPSV